jgi:hypothetical protein
VQVAEKVEGEVEEQVARQIREVKRMDRKVIEAIYSFQQRLQTKHQFVYALLVFTGFLLFWYGGWRIISSIPLFSNGLIAMALGLFLLAVPGAIYKKLGN